MVRIGGMTVMTKKRLSLMDTADMVTNSRRVASHFRLATRKPHADTARHRLHPAAIRIIDLVQIPVTGHHILPFTDGMVGIKRNRVTATEDHQYTKRLEAISETVVTHLPTKHTIIRHHERSLSSPSTGMVQCPVLHTGTVISGTTCLVRNEQLRLPLGGIAGGVDGKAEHKEVDTTGLLILKGEYLDSSFGIECSS